VVATTTRPAVTDPDAVDRDPERRGPPRQSAAIGQRVHHTAAAVDKAADILGRSGQRGDPRPVQGFDRHAILPPGRGALQPEGQRVRVVRRLHPSGADIVAGDGEAVDEAPYRILRLRAEAVQPGAALRPEGGLAIGAEMADAGDHLPAVPPGAAMAGRMGLQHHHPRAGIGQVDGGRQPGIACPDHQHIGGHRPAHRRALGRGLAAGRGPEVGERAVPARVMGVHGRPPLW
jgi:hypothetical protein